MTRKRAESADQTSFGTPRMTETPRALRSPPVASGEPGRLLSSTPFQSSSGECRLILGASMRNLAVVVALFAASFFAACEQVEEPAEQPAAEAPAEAPEAVMEEEMMGETPEAEEIEKR